MRRCPGLILAAVLAGALAALAAPASPASAHAYLAASSPADGSVLQRAPELVTLSFTEAVELSATRIQIVDGDGQRYAPTSMTLRHTSADDAASAGDTEAPVDVVLGLPNLPPNVYHVTWRTLSSDDLHTTNGNLVFGVQRTVRAAAGAPRPAGPAPLETALRWLGLLGACLLVGGAALALLTGAATDVRRRLLRVAAGGGALAMVAAPALLTAQLYAGRTGGGRLLLNEVFNTRWLAYELGQAVLTTAVLIARTRGRRGIAIGVPAALAVAYTAALLGHASGASLALRTVTAVHLLAAGGWAGSVVAGAVALVPLLRASSPRGPAVTVLLRSFAVLAAGCLALLAVTGLLMAGNQIATVDALITSPYGLLLIAKLTAVGIAGLLGLRTARRLRTARGIDHSPTLARGLITEAAVLVVALGLAAAMASAGPARGPRYEAVAVKPTSQASGQVADLVDAVTVRPNLPGRNVITVAINETRRPAVSPIGGVSIVLHGPDGQQTVHPVSRTSDGLWSVATDDIRSPGAWQISVTVLRAGLPAVTDTHPWGVAGGGRPVVSAATLRPAATVLALLLTVGFLGAAALWQRRRRLLSVSRPAWAEHPAGIHRRSSVRVEAP